MGLCSGLPYLLPPPGSISRGGGSSSQRKHKTSSVCPRHQRTQRSRLPRGTHGRENKPPRGEAAPGRALAPRPQPLFKFGCLYGGVNAITCPNFDASRLDWKPPRLPQFKMVSVLAHFNEQKAARALLPPRRKRLNHSSKRTFHSRTSPRLFCGSVAGQRAPVISLHRNPCSFPCPRLQKRILAPGSGSGLLGRRMLFPSSVVPRTSHFLHFSQAKARAAPLGSHKTTARSRTHAEGSKSDSFPFPIPLASGHDPNPMLLI